MYLRGIILGVFTKQATTDIFRCSLHPQAGGYGQAPYAVLGRAEEVAGL